MRQFYLKNEKSKPRGQAHGQPLFKAGMSGKAFNKLLLTFFPLALLFGSVQAQSDLSFMDKPVHPMGSEAGSVGIDTSVPHVNVNEYTGKVRVTLPTIGVGDLTVTPYHKNSGRYDSRTQQGRPSPLSYTLGRGWALHRGYITTRMVSRHGAEKVVYFNPQGERTDFQIDNLFQDERALTAPSTLDNLCTTCSGIYHFRDSHWIDNNLRRITRQIWRDASKEEAMPFGESDMLMMEPNGKRTYFKVLPGSLNAGYAIYVPYREIFPDGREITMTYRPFVYGGGGPQIETMEDRWQRRLVFQYVDDLPSRITLEKGSEVRDLVSFQYTQITSLNGYQVPTLKKMTSAEGQSFEMSYGTPEEPSPMLTGIRLPSGGEIKIRYSVKKIFAISQGIGAMPTYLCNPYDRICPDEVEYINIEGDQTRVSEIEYGEAKHSFEYTQLERADSSDFARMRVTVTTQGLSQTPRFDRPVETYTRVMTYFAEPFRVENGPYAPLTFVTRAGLVESIDETYTVRAMSDFSGTASETHTSTVRKEFTYRSGGFLGAPPSGVSGFQPKRPDRVAEERVTRDGTTFVTAYEYEEIEPVGAFGPIILEPKTIKRYVLGQEDQTYEEETFSFTHHFLPVADQYEDIFFDINKRLYFLGLQTGTQRNLFYNGVSHTTNKEQLELVPLSAMRYQNEILVPPVRRRMNFRGPNDAITTTFSYHGIDSASSDPFASRSQVSNSETSMQMGQYQYGMPTELTPNVASARETRTYDLSGQLLSITKHGHTTAFRYDRDFRQTQRIDQSGEMATEFTTYAPNGESWKLVRHGNVETKFINDAWGRPVETRKLLDEQNGTPYYKTERQGYNAIGMVDTKVNTMGAVTQSEFDVLGRPVRTRVKANQNIETTFNYEVSSLGHQTTVERTLVQGQSKGFVKVEASDVFGRVFESMSWFSDSPFSDPRDLAGEQVVRTDYRYLSSGSLAGMLVETVAPGHGFPRWRVVDWSGNLRAEYHPEHDQSLADIPDPDLSLVGSGITRYEYDAENRLVLISGPNGSFVHSLHYDDLGRLVSRRDVHGNELEGYVFDTEQVNHLLETRRNGVVRSFSDFNGRNQPRSTTLSIPEPLAAPDQLVPGDNPGSKASVTFSWSGTGFETFILEFRIEGFPSITFKDIEGDHVTLDRQAFEQRIQEFLAFGVIDQETATAYEAGFQNGSFYDSARDHSWRVRGVTEAGEPSFWSAWQNWQGNFPCDVTFEVSNASDIPLLSWDVEVCRDGITPRVLVSSSDIGGACALDQTVWLEGAMVFSGTATADWMLGGFSLDSQNHLNQGSGSCPQVDTVLFQLELVDAGNGETLYLSEPQEGRLNLTDFTVEMTDVVFGTVSETTQFPLPVTVHGATSQNPAAVDFRVINADSNAFSIDPEFLSFDSESPQNVMVTYRPQQVEGDQAELEATVVNGPQVVVTLFGRKQEEICEGRLFTTTATHDFGLTFVGDGDAAKTWEGRLWNETMNSCMRVESYQIQYLQGAAGLSLVNAGQLPVRLDGLQEWRPQFRFSPTVPGPIQAQVTFTDNNGETVVIMVEGEGVMPGRFLVSASAATPPVAIGNSHYGDLHVGAEARLTLYVHNVGGITQGFTAGVSGEGFITNSSSVPLAPGTSSPIWIDITATREGLQPGVLSIYPEDSATPVVEVALSVNGTAGSAFTVSPSGPTDLGEIYLHAGGSVSKTITNTSGAVLSRISVRAGEGFEGYDIGPGELGNFAVGEREYPRVSVGNVGKLGPFMGEVCYDAYDVNNALIDTQCELMYGTVKSFMDYVAMETPEIPAVSDGEGQYVGAGFLRLGRLRQRALIRVSLEDPNPADGNRFSFDPDTPVTEKEFWFDSSWTTLMVYKSLQIFFEGDSLGDYACNVKVKVLEAAGSDLRPYEDVTETSFVVHAMPAEDLDVSVSFQDTGECGWIFDDYTPSTLYRRRVSLRNNMDYAVYMEASVDYQTAYPGLAPFVYSLDGTDNTSGFDHLEKLDRVWVLVPAGSSKNVDFYHNTDFAVYEEEVEPPSNPFEEQKPAFPQRFSTTVDVKPMGARGNVWLEQQFLCLVSPYQLGDLECVCPQ